jgi:hypothetical protein
MAYLHQERGPNLRTLVIVLCAGLLSAVAVLGLYGLHGLGHFTRWERLATPAAQPVRLVQDDYGATLVLTVAGDYYRCSTDDCQRAQFRGPPTPCNAASCDEVVQPCVPEGPAFWLLANYPRRRADCISRDYQLFETNGTSIEALADDGSLWGWYAGTYAYETLAVIPLAGVSGVVGIVVAAMWSRQRRRRRSQTSNP